MRRAVSTALKSALSGAATSSSSSSCCSTSGSIISSSSSSAAAAAAGLSAARALSTYTFAGLADAPPPAGSSSISIKVGGDAKAATVEVKAGRAAAKASYPPNSIKALQAAPLTLHEAARVSVLHASLMEYLLRLAHERYALLAQWPDFSAMFGKDYYYRAHPDEVRKFYALVDDFHRMYDAATEFDSLSHLASQMVPGVRRRRLNTLGPAVSPTVADGVVTQFLLAHAK